MSDIKNKVEESRNKNFNVAALPKPSELMNTDPNEIIEGGHTLVKTQTEFTTAIQVQRPRNLQDVIRRCEEEAAIAGDDFFYSWKQGGQQIEGLSVGAVLAMVRNWGNSVLIPEVEERFNSYIFKATFIDLETGFTLSRAFKQNKKSPTTKEGKPIYSGERGDDIIFQIGQSKAIRNVGANAMPKWLITKVMDKAKENVMKKLEKMGKDKATQMILKKAEVLGISKERIYANYGKEAGWDMNQLVFISGALKAVESGMDSVNDVMPKIPVSEMPQTAPEPKTQAEPKTDTPQAEAPVKEKPEPKPDAKEEEVKRGGIAAELEAEKKKAEKGLKGNKPDPGDPF